MKNMISEKQSYLPSEQIKYSTLEDCCNVVRDIPYAGKTGNNFFNLDIYYKEGDKDKPVVVFVHGGGWTGGDKSNIEKNDRMVKFFIDKGFLLVGVNFRLLQGKDTPGVTFKDQVNDISESLKWISRNIVKYGGDPHGIILVGYSSGAHLAALLATDNRYLSRRGMSIDFIKGVILIDVPAYDIPKALALMPNTPLEDQIPFMKSIFSKTNEASPINFISKAGAKHFLIISAGIKDNRPQNVTNFVSKLFAGKLSRAGHHATQVHLAERSHISLIMEFGRQNDEFSNVLGRFLNTVRKEAF